ncbi:hypothetical protein [Neptunomonas sp. XY-337]|uniref:hypothetical protein n=1 Tax=Neptunomonas sp. XY-337 TaxID=2561897 RepID=UPI0010A9D44C|nr:hypothetical protein [Neptunomonas sp. XY-337]
MTMNDPTIIIAILSAALLSIYFSCVLYGERTKPDLLEALSLILTSGGAVSAIQLGYICIFMPNVFTGVLESQRVPIMAGAFAILWVSISVTYKLFKSHIQLQQTPATEST